MPETMLGIKFDNESQPELSWSISFTTTRAPVWGGFYAKDGKTSQVDVTAWNAGFGSPDPDPTVDPRNGSVDNHILRPDTGHTLVPEPTTLLLLGFGLLGIAGIGRRLKK